jgi:hypothetical protein
LHLSDENAWAPSLSKIFDFLFIHLLRAARFVLYHILDIHHSSWRIDAHIADRASKAAHQQFSVILYRLMKGL